MGAPRRSPSLPLLLPSSSSSPSSSPPPPPPLPQSCWGRGASEGGAACHLVAISGTLGPEEERHPLLPGHCPSQGPAVVSVPLCPQRPYRWLSPGCHMHTGQIPQSPVHPWLYFLCSIFIPLLPSHRLSGSLPAPRGPVRHVLLLHFLSTTCPSLAPRRWLHLLGLGEPPGALQHTMVCTPSSGPHRIFGCGRRLGGVPWVRLP